MERARFVGRRSGSGGRRAATAVVALLVVLAGGCTDRSAQTSVSASAPDPDEYRRMCYAALAAAKEFGRRLRTSSTVDAPPTIVSTGPPVRIRCRIMTRDGAPGTVTADVRCMDAFDRTCIGPVAARIQGVVVQGPGRGPTT